MNRLILLAALVLWLAGCGASPDGPVAEMRGLYKGPIADTGGPVLVHPVGVRAGTGGVFLDIAVEGPREDAMWAADMLGRGIYFFRWPEVDKVSVTDNRGIVRLRSPRDDPGPLFGTVHYRNATWIIHEEDGRARLMIVLPLRCRIPQSPVRVVLSEEGIRESLVANAGRDAFVPNKLGKAEMIRAREVLTRVEAAQLDVTPQPVRPH